MTTRDDSGPSDRGEPEPVDAATELEAHGRDGDAVLAAYPSLGYLTWRVDLHASDDGYARSDADASPAHSDTESKSDTERDDSDSDSDSDDNDDSDSDSDSDRERHAVRRPARRVWTRRRPAAAAAAETSSDSSTSDVSSSSSSGSETGGARRLRGRMRLTAGMTVRMLVEAKDRRRSRRHRPLVVTATVPEFGGAHLCWYTQERTGLLAASVALDAPEGATVLAHWSLRCADPDIEAAIRGEAGAERRGAALLLYAAYACAQFGAPSDALRARVERGHAAPVYEACGALAAAARASFAANGMPVDALECTVLRAQDVRDEHSRKE